MTTQTWYRNQVGQGAFEPEASRPFLRDLAADCPDDDSDGDIAEIRRMIELSGMISPECILFEADTVDAPAAHGDC